MAIEYTGTIAYNTSSFTQDQFSDVFSHSSGVLSTLHAAWGTVYGSVDGWNFYLGSGTDHRVAYIGIGSGSGRVFVGALDVNGSAYGGDIPPSSGNIRMATSGKAISFMNLQNDGTAAYAGTSLYGFILALDDTGEICTIVSNGTKAIRNDPIIVSQNSLYSKSVYGGNTATGFGQITLERIPSAQPYATPRYVKDVYFASTNPTISDGAIEHGGNKFYCIGGGIILRDYL